MLVPSTRHDPYRINEQVTFTDGRIVVSGRRGRRRPGKRADYVLRYRADFPIAVVEAKASYASPGDGLQQAKDYAEILGLKFAYATNGHGIIEFDFTTGLERELTVFPTPEELWTRLHNDEQISDEASKAVLAPAYRLEYDGRLATVPNKEIKNLLIRVSEGTSIEWRSSSDPEIQSTFRPLNRILQPSSDLVLPVDRELYFPPFLKSEGFYRSFLINVTFAGIATAANGFNHVKYSQFFDGIRSTSCHPTESNTGNNCCYFASF